MRDVFVQFRGPDGSGGYYGQHTMDDLDGIVPHTGDLFDLPGWGRMHCINTWIDYDVPQVHVICEQVRP